MGVHACVDVVIFTVYFLLLGFSMRIIEIPT